MFKITVKHANYPEILNEPDVSECLWYLCFDEEMTPLEYQGGCKWEPAPLFA